MFRKTKNKTKTNESMSSKVLHLKINDYVLMKATHDVKDPNKENEHCS